MAHVLVTNPKAPEVRLNFHQANVGGQLPAGSPLPGAAKKHGAAGTRELPLDSQLHLEPSLAWALLSWRLTVACFRIALSTLFPAAWRCSRRRPTPALTHACAEGQLCLPCKVGCERGCTRLTLNLERPLAVLGAGSGRPRAFPGFGVGPRLRSPGMCWTAPARRRSF